MVLVEFEYWEYHRVGPHTVLGCLIRYWMLPGDAIRRLELGVVVPASGPSLGMQSWESSKFKVSLACLVTLFPKTKLGTGETAQRLRSHIALTAVGEDVGLVPSTRLVGDTCLELPFPGIWHFLLAFLLASSGCTDNMRAKHPYTYKNKCFFKR